MATSDEQRAAVRADVLDWLRGQCNKMTNGECHTRSCMIRGGWKESRDYDCATCHAYEAFTALGINPQQSNGAVEKPAKEPDAAIGASQVPEGVANAERSAMQLCPSTNPQQIASETKEQE